MTIRNLSFYLHWGFIQIGFLFFFCDVYGNQKNSSPDIREIDSVYKVLSNCKSDSARVYNLSLMFRKYRNRDSFKAGYYCDWLFHNYTTSNDRNAAGNAFFLKGESLMDNKKYDSAIFCFKSAIPFANSLLKGKCLFRLGTINDFQGKQDEAILNLIEANNYFTLVNSSKNIHGTYDLLIDIYARKGDYNHAINYIQKKIKLDIIVNNHRKLETDNLYAAFLYEQLNSINMSFVHLNRALKIAETDKDFENLIRIYGVIANLFAQNGNLRMAVEYYKKGLEKSFGTDFNEQRVEIYNKLCRIYIEQKNDSAALINNLKAIALAQKLNNKLNLAEGYANLGYYYKNKNNVNASLYYFLKSYEIGILTKSPLAFFDITVEIADLYFYKANNTLALNWYNTCLVLSQNFNSKKDIAIAKFKTGKYYQGLSQLSVAEKYYIEAMQFAEESKQPLIIKNIADILSEFYKLKNDYKKAYKYQEISQLMGNSIQKTDGKANLATLEMEHEFENIKKENAIKQTLANEEIKRQKLLRDFLLIISALLVVLGVIVFINYRKKRKDNIILLSQKLEIEEKNIEILAQVEEIRSQKDEIERISSRLHQIDQMKLRFFSNISHEIRTPLTLIINPLKEFIEGFKGEREQHRNLEIIENNALRLNELTNQILDIQKLDSGSLHLNLVETDVTKLLHEISGSFEGLVNKTSIHFLYESDFNSVICQVDPDKLTKIISNLLTNAFKYTNPGGSVVLSLRFEESKIIISVKDNGIGMPQEQLKNIFKRYYQLEGSNVHFEGTGIGLAYVKELVELMNGTVDVKSNPGEGSDFMIEIPVSEINIMVKDVFSVEYKPRLKSVATADKYDIINEEVEDASPIVLIVEDNDDLRSLIGKIFSDNYKVIYAQDGFDGYEKARKFLPDIIISDILMPKKDGLEMCAEIKNNEPTSHIPVILLTAKDGLENQLSGYKQGAVDYIVKPFESALLKLKVKNIISGQTAAKKQFNFESIVSPGGIKSSDLDNEFVRKCINLIKENIDNPRYNIDELAGALAYGRRSFFRKMKAVTDMSPHEFIMAYKLRYAASLLKNGLRVTEVADNIGFENAKSFTIAFKKFYGVLPSDYK
jgi:signal transduction histidine kinase/DNA-binding response OmpR family regulator